MVCVFGGLRNCFTVGSIQDDPLLPIEITCGSLLYELQIIWDEVGESEADRNKILLELEQECLDLYMRRVDVANRSRAQLRLAIADAEAEIAASCSAMGELPSLMRQNEQKARTLKEEYDTILSQLEVMRKMKTDRKNLFIDVIGQIEKIYNEIDGSAGDNHPLEVVDDNDLTLRRLQELQIKLQSLQKEKSDRLNQIHDKLGVLSSLCSVLGLDFKETASELHPSLVDSEEINNISPHTLQQVESAIKTLRELKLQRRQKLQELAMMLVELWNLLDTPIEEQQEFQNVTCNIASSEDEITEPNMLSAHFIVHVEAEVYRLEEFKSSKMKELVLKKREELEEICRKAHLVPELDGETEHLIDAVESGDLDPASVLEQIELEIAKVKEEAFDRNEILEKVEKWLAAREEEKWLEEYNMDQTRYNAGRGSHLVLKRAEKARTLITKLPGMMETLAAKTQTWEDERGVDFLYDGIHLLSMLEEYMILRQEKEQEKKRHLEQKKGNVEQGVLSGTKSSLMKAASKKISKMFSRGSKRGSFGGNILQTPRPTSSQSAKVLPNPRPPKGDDITVVPESPMARVFEKNFSFNGRETERRTFFRRSFSPISSRASTRALEDFYDDENQTFSKNLSSQRPFITPLRRVSSAGDEVKHIFEPTTSYTVSAPMHTSGTPAPLQQPDVHDSEDQAAGVNDEIEYSFEEIRAGFVLPSTQSESTEV